MARHSKSAQNNRPDQYLPDSHTCFFTLDLPRYSSIGICCEKLRYAITHCISVDGDSSLNHGGADMNADSGDE